MVGHSCLSSYTKLMVTVCLTIAPAFLSAAIYFYRNPNVNIPIPSLRFNDSNTSSVNALGSEHSKFNPRWYYWGFIPCDNVSIALQGAGGGLSSSGTGDIRVDVSLAGLAFQVFTPCIFITLVADYMCRWRRNGSTILTTRFKIFAYFFLSPSSSF